MDNIKSFVDCHSYSEEYNDEFAFHRNLAFEDLMEALSETDTEFSR